MFVCVSPHAPSLDDDHHNFDDFPKPHLQSGLICFISPDTFPPPPPSATFFSYRFGGSNFSCTTLTPHLALLTSHLACVTHVPAGGVFLSFVGFWILFGLLVAYCELANRWCPKEKKSRKIIEPTSAPVNIEMTTASGGEAALPRDKGEEVQIV